MTRLQKGMTVRMRPLDIGSPWAYGKVIVASQKIEPYQSVVICLEDYVPQLLAVDYQHETVKGLFGGEFEIDIRGPETEEENT